MTLLVGSSPSMFEPKEETISARKIIQKGGWPAKLKAGENPKKMRTEKLSSHHITGIPWGEHTKLDQ